VGAQKGACAPALASRHCKGTLRYSDPFKATGQFMAEMEAFCEENPVDLIVPITDLTTTILLSESNTSEKLPQLATPSREAYFACSDKFLTYKKSKELDIATPQTWLCTSAADSLKIVEQYPLVVKDRFSIRYMEDELLSGEVNYALAPGQLQKLVGEHLIRFPDLLVQGFATGTGTGLAFFCDGERAYSPFMWERLREKDPRGSGSSARRSIPLDEVLLGKCQELLTCVGFVGIAMIEFKAVEGGGEAVFMEVNARPWGSLQLAVHCGVDYPKMLVEWHLSGKRPPERRDYPVGLTCRWLKADLIHLENLRQRRREPWPLPYPSFLTSILKVALPWYPGMHYDHLSLQDIKPGIVDLADWLKQKLRLGGAK
jgi:predicted ATP-grasp superfamily ATP-dependent carboligase